MKINKKIKEWNEVCKKYIIYLFERVDREQEKLTLFFDCSNSGLFNVDTELLWFIISLLKNYYPMMLHTILVYELPWVLNFVFKLLHSWLPHDQRQLLHPITKKDVHDFVSPDQLPDFLNGTSDLPYKSTPKHVQYAIDLAPQLSIGKSAAEQLTQQYQPYM